MEEAGLYINSQYPYLGASSDGKVKCDCCGYGIIEIKYPFCLTKMDMHDAAENKKFCLMKDEEKFSLNHTHAYYYQVQLPLQLTEASFCDFVVWQKHADRVSL